MTDAGTHFDLIAELEWRGLVKDCTDLEALRDHLRTPGRKIYCGFDPTAESLTIGNLVPIMMLAHAQRAGHTPVVVMGGGTGLIGDPSGKSAERQLMTRETVTSNIHAQREIFEHVMGNAPGGTPFDAEEQIKNNLDWLGGLSYLDALRDVGKHFSVNMMMQKESIRERLHTREQGISYTEFSYMILQAYDFAHLYEHKGVTVQFGGSDQYGNIVEGKRLIRRKRAAMVSDVQFIIINMADQMGIIKLDDDFKDIPTSFRDGKEVPGDLDVTLMAEDCHTKIMSWLDWAQDKEGMFDRALVDGMEYYLRQMAWVKQGDSFGLTAPLVEKADGTKFGKTESGAVWLTAAFTSPYAYYQFWLNASDDDARDWIKVFTFLDHERCEALIAAHDENPGKRELQRTLAREATRILHGDEAMEHAEVAGKALFSGDIASLDEATLAEVFANIPSSEHAIGDLDAGVDPVEILKATGLASSNREAREFLANGSVSVNGEKIDADTRLTRVHLLHGSMIAIRRGKKNWHLTRWA